MQITFNVPDNKVERIADAFAGTYPIALDSEHQPAFTKPLWVKECIKGFVIQTVMRFERDRAMNAIQIDTADLVE